MKWRWWYLLFIPPAIVFFTWICGEVVMHLWNWLAPMLFGLHQITFWQALGLLILCRILFGSWSGGDRSKSRRRRAEQWEGMTPEEREKFRQGMRCGPFGRPPADIKDPA